MTIPLNSSHVESKQLFTVGFQSKTIHTVKSQSTLLSIDHHYVAFTVCNILLLCMICGDIT